jgi:hypothetical protein
MTDLDTMLVSYLLAVYETIAANIAPPPDYEVTDLYTWLGIDGDPVGPVLGSLVN